MATNLYNLTSAITIGNILFTSVHEVEIRSTFRELTETATVKLPRNLKLKGKWVRDLIRQGDPVIIKLGYNDNLAEEFTGYVREVDPAAPLVITCENEMYQLKRKTITRSWESVKLVELLRYIAPGYELEALDMSVGKFQINGASPAKVLQELQDQYRLFSYFRGKKLHVGFAYPKGYSTHIYDFQRNVRNSSLRYRSAENTKLQVRAVANLSSGKKIIEMLGDEEGELRTLNFGGISQEELKRQAKEELKRFKFDGYRGDITGWGVPITRHGDLLTIRDSRYPEREGNYFIDGVTIRFGQEGYQRINELGPTG